MATNKREKQPTYRWFCDVLAIASLHDSAHQSLDAAHLAYGDFVPHVVTGEIGEDTRSAGDHVDVIVGEKLDQHL